MRPGPEELINIPVYPWGRSIFGGDWEDVTQFCRENALDGVELYIGYEALPPAEIPSSLVKSVHLPFHSGWLEMMEKREHIQFEPPFFPCATHEDFLAALRLQLERAAGINAAYAVYHVGYYHTKEMFLQEYARNDTDVLTAAAAFLNELVSVFPGGEPPVRLQFENLWYPGLTYTDPDAILAFMDLLAFSNYGFLLDTGHLMNRIATSDAEADCIAAVCRCVETLPQEILDKIDVVHLHWSGSYTLRQERIRRGIPNGFAQMERHDQETFAFQHATLTDQHRPVSLPAAWEIVELIDPSVVVHECVPKTLTELKGFLALQRGALKGDG